MFATILVFYHFFPWHFKIMSREHNLLVTVFQLAIIFCLICLDFCFVLHLHNYGSSAKGYFFPVISSKQLFHFYSILYILIFTQVLHFYVIKAADSQYFIHLCKSAFLFLFLSLSFFLNLKLLKQ